MLRDKLGSEGARIDPLFDLKKIDGCCNMLILKKLFPFFEKQEEL
jgi:hypothetical protein